MKNNFTNKKNFWMETLNENDWILKLLFGISFIAVTLLLGKVIEPIFVALDICPGDYNVLAQFMSGLLVLLIFVLLILVIQCIYYWFSKEFAIARYCKLPLTKEEIITGKEKGLFSTASEYIKYVAKQLMYNRGKNWLYLSEDEERATLKNCIEVFDLKKDDVISGDGHIFYNDLIIAERNMLLCVVTLKDDNESNWRYSWFVNEDGSLRDVNV